MMTETIVSIALGLGLAAASGLRVFVPIFVAGLAAHFDVITLSPGFSWVESWPALLALGTATVLEIGAYFVPWLDHVLDVIATPTAIAAGVLASASVIAELPPALKWGVAIVGGGGMAGLVQMLTVALRVKSSLTTGGVANPVLATVESGGSVVLSILAIAIPVVCVLLLAVSGVFIFRASGRLRRWKRRTL